MKKIFGLAIAAVLMMALVAGGTWAFFSDTETASGNTLTAGTLNLAVGTDGATDAFTVTGVKPGTAATTGKSWAVQNTGSLNGTLQLTVSAITNSENSVIEPETQYGDITSGATEGELGAKLQIALWYDAGTQGTWDSGDYFFQNDGTVVAYSSGSSLPAAAWGTVDSYGGDTWTTGAPTINGNTTTGLSFKVQYKFDDSLDTTDNVAQGDGVQFDVTFTLKQS